MSTQRFASEPDSIVEVPFSDEINSQRFTDSVQSPDPTLLKGTKEKLEENKGPGPGSTSPETFDKLNKVVARYKRVIKDQNIKLKSVDREFWEQDRAHHIEKEQLQKKILNLESRLDYSSEADYFAHLLKSNTGEDGPIQNSTLLRAQQRRSAVISRLSKALVKIILSRATLASISNDWKTMEALCQQALEFATELDDEPLTAYCEYNRGIALYGLRKREYALEVFSKSLPCIDIHATRQMWDAWMEKIRQPYPNARLPTPELSQAHTAEERQTASSQSPLNSMPHRSRNSVSYSDTTNQTSQSLHRSGPDSKLKSFTVLSDELAGLGYFEDDISPTQEYSNEGAPWESDSSHATLSRSHDHYFRCSHSGASIESDSYASSIDNRPPSLDLHFESGFNRADREETNQRSTRRVSDAALYMNASSTETPVHLLGTFTRFYRRFISSDTDKSLGPPAPAATSKSPLDAEKTPPASPKNLSPLDGFSQTSGSPFPALSTQPSRSPPSTYSQRPQIGVNISPSTVGKATNSENPSIANVSYLHPRQLVPLTAEALLQLGEELRTSYSARSTAAASMLESRIVRSAGTPSVGAWNEDTDNEAEIRDGGRKAVSEYGGLNGVPSLMFGQRGGDMRCEVSSIESSENEMADLGHNVEEGSRGLIGKVVGALGNFLMKPFQRRELVTEEDL